MRSLVGSFTNTMSKQVFDARQNTLVRGNDHTAACIQVCMFCSCVQVKIFWLNKGAKHYVTEIKPGQLALEIMSMRYARHTRQQTMSNQNETPVP